MSHDGDQCRWDIFWWSVGQINHHLTKWSIGQTSHLSNCWWISPSEPNEEANNPHGYPPSSRDLELEEEEGEGEAEGKMLPSSKNKTVGNAKGISGANKLLPTVHQFRGEPDLLVSDVICIWSTKMFGFEQCFVLWLPSPDFKSIWPQTRLSLQDTTWICSIGQFATSNDAPVQCRSDRVKGFKFKVKAFSLELKL